MRRRRPFGLGDREWPLDEDPVHEALKPRGKQGRAVLTYPNPQTPYLSFCYGVDSIYLARGSVFPTSGRANPTMMVLALAIRLADHLNARLGGESDHG
jgi:hypothetical protein